jgi:predicted unusual protein kinase regulating ubiquinone biosynthesis (AarF/ABC1/UbiB family)
MASAAIVGSCRENYEAIEEAYDLIGLLKEIQAIMYSYQGQQHKTHALVEAQKRLYTMIQEQNMTCSESLERFKVMVSVVEHCGGKISYDLNRVVARVDAGMDRVAAESEAREEYLGVLFLIGSDRS